MTPPPRQNGGEGDVGGVIDEDRKERNKNHGTILTSVTSNAFCQMF